MARQRRGRELTGWLLIDKPVGPSSAQVVAKARWALGAAKAGHAGTLDPLASGLIAIAFGEATKTVPQVQEGAKTYRFTVRLGQATETDDAEGRVIAEDPSRPTDAEIVAALASFQGDIEQVPPAFSAVKLEGERAYDAARAGKALELAARPLHVARLDLIARPDPDHAVLEMVCGKGGYVRSLARDLGQALGCYGYVAELRRLASGAFTLADAMAFDRLDQVRVGECEAPLRPLEAGLTGLVEVPVAPPDAAKLAHGQALPAAAARAGCAAEGSVVWASCGGRAVALCRVQGGGLKPHRVFKPAQRAEHAADAEQLMHPLGGR